MRDQRGFSLVEILFAFMILMLVITMSLAAFIERSKRLQQASEIILAYQALANEAEYRRRVVYADLDESNPAWDPEFFPANTEILKPMEPFGTIVSVKEVQPGVKHVLMTIRWRDGQRQAKLELVRVDTGGGNLW